MLVTFCTSMVGQDFGYHAGDTADIQEDTAFRLVQAGYAVPAVEPIEHADNPILLSKPRPSRSRGRNPRFQRRSYNGP